MYPYIAPENFEDSKISSISNDQFFIKIDDLLLQKEITTYIHTKEKLIEIFEKYCEFFKFSEDKEKVQYILPDGMTVFSILNRPSTAKLKMPPHITEVQRPMQTKKAALSGIFTMPKP